VKDLIAIAIVVGLNVAGLATFAAYALDVRHWAAAHRPTVKTPVTPEDPPPER
jgi:hypothetical protein